MRSRNWSIRSKIIALITVPLVALFALWIFATALTAGPAFNLLSARTLLDKVSNPGVELAGQLQRERLFSVEYLSADGSVPQALKDQRAATDRAAADFRRAAGGADAQGAAPDALRNRISQIFTELDSLDGNRAHIDRREIDAIGAQGFYNGVIDANYQMFAATATFNDEGIDRELRALNTVGHGEEYLSRVDSLVAGATAAGQFDGAVRSELLQDVGTARFLLAQGVDDMTADERTAYVKLSSGEPFIQLSRMMDTLVAQSREGSPSPVASATFRPAYVEVAQELRSFEVGATDSMATRATPVAVGILVRLGVAGVLGLVALVLSILVSIKVGRSIVGRLRRLRAEAHEMAEERLPAVVLRLQRGEAVDVDVETPPLRYGRDEIGQLGRAFNDVQRTAVRSAVEEATVRRGINEVFLNIARRSQTLLHRQLALLDKMERRETEPQELEDLYRVDHLATRMRRHAEDLVILAGAAPGRGWRNPVPVIDVVRGAISEVEDYKRVDIRSVEASAVLGRAVGDVIHLLAELLENAASFSPPQTRVQVVGQVLPSGYAIEIEDRGLGMAPEAIEEANRRLFQPPDFDPTDSARLGLFVVAQLASRHGIRVSLRPSAYAGVTATVLIPGELVAAGPGQAALPAGAATGSPAAKPWDRPLVGSGADDPSRHSLAALQWQGTEELRQVTVTGRPVTINSIVRSAPATGWEPNGATGEGQHRAPAVPAGPAPSVVADELSADGLVQRRRIRRPVDLGSAPGAAEPASRATPRDPAVATPAPLTPMVEAPPATPPGLPSRSSSGPSAGLPSRPSSGPPAGLSSGPSVSVGPPAADRFESTEDGLPRRVRLASLAPQLRNPVAEADKAAAPVRSPEQVRSLMSALQLGTTRGRIDASRFRQEPQPAGGPERQAAGGAEPRTDRPSEAADRPSEAGGRPSEAGDRRSESPVDVRPELPAATAAALTAETTTELTTERTAEVTEGLRAELRKRRSESPRRRRPGSPEDLALRDAGGRNRGPEAEETGIEARRDDTSFADAATVSFPTIVNAALARGEAPPGTEGAAGGRAERSGDNDVTRPEKDA